MAKTQLLIRSDDLGYSEAVNYGLEKALRFGMTKSVGLMTNMDAASHGLHLIRDLNVCIGQHTNICVGKPVSNPDLIPSLVNSDGTFKSSREYRSTPQDFVALDEAVLEVEAQYQRFKDLTGREPEYFEGHAVRSANFIKALEMVAEQHNLKYSAMYMPGQPVAAVGKGKAYRCAMHSMAPDYNPAQSLKDAVLSAPKDLPSIFVCHPGYLDDFILQSSSLTINRTKEVAMLCDPTVKAWLDEHGVELVSYNDIGN